MRFLIIMKNYNFIDYYQVMHKLCPGVFAIQIIKTTVSVLKNVIFLALIGFIINSFILKANITKLLSTVICCILIVFICDFIFSITNAKTIENNKLMNINAENNMTKRFNEVNYDIFSNGQFRKLYSAAKTGFQYTNGFKQLTNNIIDSFLSFVIMLFISFSSIIRTLTQTHVHQYFNNVLYYISIIMIVVFPILSSILFSRKEGNIMHNFFEYNMKFNRYLDYYSNILFRKIKYANFLKIFDPTNNLVENVQHKLNCKLNKDIDLQIKASSWGNLVSITTGLSIGLLYCILSVKVIHHEMSLGLMVTCIGYLQLLIGYIGKMISSWNNRKSSFETINQYLEFMNFDKQEIKKYEKKLNIQKDGLKIEFKHVFFKYKDSTDYILKDINLSFNTNEVIALVGPNGSGKTTLIKLLIGFYKPNKGKILINGLDIQDISPCVLNSLFSVVFQDFSLFAWSIKDNLSVNKNSDKEIEKTLHNVNFGNKLYKLKDGIDTFITQKFKKNGVNFSGGEKQKLAIARAMLKNAPISIFDEPTAALDPITESKVFENIEKISKNSLITIFISHRMSSTKFSDRIYVLDKGQLISTGSHQELMHKCNLYRNMYIKQAKYYQNI